MAHKGMLPMADFHLRAFSQLTTFLHFSSQNEANKIPLEGLFENLSENLFKETTIALKSSWKKFAVLRGDYIY